MLSKRHSNAWAVCPSNKWRVICFFPLHQRGGVADVCHIPRTISVLPCADRFCVAASCSYFQHKKEIAARTLRKSAANKKEKTYEGQAMCWSAFSVFIIALISHIVNLNSPAFIKLEGDFLLFKNKF